VTVVIPFPQMDLRHGAEQEALARLGLGILRGEDMALVWDSALRDLVAVVGAWSAEILELDTAGPHLVLRAATGWNTMPAETVPVRPDRLPWRDLLRDGVTVVDERRSPPDPWSRVLASQRTESSAYGMIRGGDDVFGVLGLHRDTTRPFTAEDLQFLALLAELVGHSIGPARAARLQGAGEHSANFAHDFNSVLTVIQGYVETLQEKVGEASPLRGDLDAIHRAAERASSLVRRLQARNLDDALAGDQSPSEGPLAPLRPTQGN
jgi:signal transduction histidine kinase